MNRKLALRLSILSLAAIAGTGSILNSQSTSSAEMRRVQQARLERIPHADLGNLAVWTGDRNAEFVQHRGRKGVRLLHGAGRISFGL
jgi:hypothetical protein